MINSDATAHCTDNQSIFENLTFRTDKLTTADEFLRIVRRENAIIILPNRFTARLDDILFMPDIETNLLFIQALLTQKIKNHNLVHEMKFNQAGEHEIVAKDSHEDKTSYLIWIQNENALFNKSARRISENTHKNQQRKTKSTKTKFKKQV